eukprot:TRINITY_DN889_c0_g2_i5.p1 TRINITY_DN889_c0_g2~~TRINITY_DN889_c0_g2_i5.p1  ORF type:complete len:101 (-),score=37.85 TRINITY_DN889_c0_g2_i5:307-609(-)
MGDMADRIRDLISEAVEEAEIVVEDVSGGCGAKFQLQVVSESFDGMNPLARQRQINTILKPVMPEIHAIQMKCMTPAQWHKKLAEQAAAAQAPAQPEDEQ